MKFLILYLFFVIALAVIGVHGNVVAGSYAFGIKVTSSRNSNPQCTITLGPECTEDCSTLMLCSSFSTAPLRTTACTAPNQYCVNGACTSNPGLNCKTGAGSVGADFLCTDVGIFPEPSDCTQYHICDAGTSVLYRCAPGFVFNSQLSMCQIGKTPCTKISCAKATEANPFVSYTSNSAYYAFCMKNDKGVFEAVMFKCPYEQFQVFDLKTKECQFKCKSRGNFQNPADCGQYCYCSGNNAQPILAICPENWVFDGTGCNKDAGKCQHTTTTTTSTTTTPDPNLLSGSESAGGSVVEGLINDLKSEIIEKICEVDQNADQKVCPSGSQSTANIVANNYKTLIADEKIYFVSLTIVGEDIHYHVRILNDQIIKEVQNVKGPTEDSDEIEYFD